jgi:thioredoxin-like negative regulator of GroEL
MKQIRLEQFKTDVLDSSQPVILFFSSAWCSGCGPEHAILNEMEEDYPEISFIMVNADETAALNTLMHVSSLPSLFAMYKGKVWDRTDGFVPAERVVQMCEKLPVNV